MNTKITSLMLFVMITFAAVTPPSLSYALAPTCTQQLENLEPPSPVTLPNPPFHQSPVPGNLLPISDVMKTGTPLAYDVIADLPNGQDRPICLIGIAPMNAGRMCPIEYISPSTGYLRPHERFRSV